MSDTPVSGLRPTDQIRADLLMAQASAWPAHQVAAGRVHDDVPALLAEVERLRAENEKLYQRVKWATLVFTDAEIEAHDRRVAAQALRTAAFDPLIPKMGRRQLLQRADAIEAGVTP